MSDHMTEEKWQAMMEETREHSQEYYRVVNQTNEEWLKEYSKPKEQ
jgi:hypothetical protein